MFSLHGRLAQDCFTLGQFALSEVLLMNDYRYPWVILVPRRADISEIYQLTVAEQQQLLHESSFVASQMATYFKADKMNIAALGNVVPQLHLHHIARYKTDASWPDPVWGKGQAEPYGEQARQDAIQQLQALFADLMQDGQ
ncbi:HIT domain-containing protein [Methylophaga sp. OBS4]|uniref:HIT domain-containing protein n=1 Tax=Methylophaga sp. OBS4 TaxID=2991935 RepID=UPI0022571559|nr:HIT domain-containing protein [Methylophaga sp. OBS4]MCX4187698.1 HIT domain-containing protein [Methylophaga sp. OBS4]